MKTNLLRTIALSVVLCLVSCVSTAQWVSIPDTNFGTWLNTHSYSSCLQGNNTIGWQMDTTCNAVVNALTLDCSFSHINDLTGIQYFDRLQNLTCGGNSFSSISALPDSLQDFGCTGMALTSLPPLPSHLSALIVNNDFLLDTLPALPGTLTDLFCGGCNFSHFPALPVGLIQFNCYGNPLHNLPPLPDSLQSINCQDDFLTSLPALPTGLQRLDCGWNFITSIPALPNSLISLAVNDNQLTSLPALPAGLQNLWCHQNQITSLPALPDSMIYLSITTNPISCLPRFNYIEYFYFDTTNIACLPVYGHVINSTPYIYNLPLCDIYNTNGCPIYWNINGKVYIDQNLNCVYVSAENPVGNVKIQLYESGILQQQTTTVSSGGYLFKTNFSTYDYSVDTSNLPFSVACPTIGYHTSVITALDSLDTDMNFGFHCKPGFDLIAESVVGRFNPNRVRPLFVSAGDYSGFFSGPHCAAGTSGSVILIISGIATYVSPLANALTPTTISGDTITWNIADFGNVNFFTDFNINVLTGASAQIGNTICITLIVTPSVGDNNPANNILTHCFNVTASADPNEKEVSPAGNIDTATKWLTYTIHFQNTGTDSAQDIYVDDTLDTNIDASTFQLLAYSHQPLVQLKENAVRFNFPNINLPDSNTNEPLSHGYVQYKVKLKNNILAGTNISNTAFIYFDFNAPVITNTTTNTIALVSYVEDISHEAHDFVIYPNPATSQLFILNGATVTEINIYNTTGSLVSQTKQLLNNYIDISQLADGVYIAEIKTKETSVRRRWVKM